MDVRVYVKQTLHKLDRC